MRRFKRPLDAETSYFALLKEQDFIINVKYKKAQNYAQRLIEKKKQFIIGQLEENIDKPKDLWKSLNLGFSARKEPNFKNMSTKQGRTLL